MLEMKLQALNFRENLSTLRARENINIPWQTGINDGVAFVTPRQLPQLHPPATGRRRSAPTFLHPRGGAVRRFIGPVYDLCVAVNYFSEGEDSAAGEWVLLEGRWIAEFSNALDLIP